MTALPNDTAGAFKAIKEAVRDRLLNLPLESKAWTRFRYADNMDQWLELAAVEAGTEEEQRLRVVFVYVAGFTSRHAEARRREITLSLGIEVIQGFYEGTDVDNSTDVYEAYLGSIEQGFKDQYGLGLTDAAGSDVVNSAFSAEDENEGKPVYVDGVLSHRITGNLTATFRLC